MTSPTAAILLPTTRTRSTSVVTSRHTRRVDTAGRSDDLSGTVGGYVSSDEGHSANDRVEGGYVSSTIYSTSADRIRGSYVSTSLSTPRTSGQGTYVTI